ncbi:AarF/UbiB family protein [Lactiplantibacillus plantarum]|uniref:ABC1 kinase family protein n=1 Tax=Lactiplantibacillus plantarum TaxID=1590 RepID=UPI000D207BC1|nr:AarF/UbiB family protein [Lactiplantibacillus plantarum]AVW00328.1 2-octaprenylphenol hydroxylase [Lactiplantibacillus plantarum]AVW08927.1 2-octaprenylphenol hydroxylase [Lactiplantibacillus plantarum]MCC9315841.1 AarF/ABC1/UbiB kinase family protein [Lactiplantibacillus plantarum]MDF3265100.1 AarF/UbiB family protein [Lactiplantibacillus plantarum]MDO1602802.1 AarF/UbiB family protein [Lactiplantibacillus plantarum]
MTNNNEEEPQWQVNQNRHTRFRTIVSVLRRYNVLSNLARQKNPDQVRAAFEELGPTFIKIGQILSSRTDIVKPEFANEFKKLQNNVRADDFSVVKQTIEQQTGKPINEMFAQFDERPFASASMGQTHHATLLNGQKVVVKVQHPGIDAEVALDISLFERALPLLRYIPESSVVDLREMVGEIKRSLFNELDTSIEVKNGLRFYRLNNADDIIRVPRVYAKYSTQKVLVNQYMPGTTIQHFMAQMLAADEDGNHQYDDERRYLAHVLVQNFLKQVFEDGFFHADPHPGNILLRELQPDDIGYHDTVPKHGGKIGKRQLPPYRLVYLDFGMMGEISPALMAGIANVVVAVTTEDTHQVGKAILAISNRTGVVDEEAFFSELAPFLSQYYNSGLGDIDFQGLLFEIVKVCRSNNIQMNPAVTMLGKAFGTIEGIVETLDPTLSMMDVARPFARKYIRENFNWRNELEDGMLASLQSLRDAPKIPSRLLSALDTFENGQTRVNLVFAHRKMFIDRIDSMVNKIVLSVILAALIVGSSLLVQSHPDNSWITNIGIFGYVSAVVVIIGLLIGTLHSWYTHWRRK